MNLTSGFINNMETRIQNEIVNRKIPGMSVVITDQNKEIYNQAFGYSDYNLKQKADIHTSYYIASLTKSFTALSFGLLHQDKKINIFEPVSKYVSSLSMKDAYINENLTFVDILSHRTGIPDNIKLLEDDIVSRQGFVDWLNNYEGNIKFREGFNYNNILYSIAGQFIEDISGLSWEEYIENKILNKVGIEKYDFSFTYSDDNRYKSKLYYSKDSSLNEIINIRKHQRNNPGGPAGSLNLSTIEISKWLRMFLNDGSIGSKSFIIPEIIKEILKPRTIVDDSIEDIITYCMGWFCKNINNDVIHYHIGSFGNYMVISRKHRIGLAVLSNIHNDYAESLMNMILQRLAQ